MDIGLRPDWHRQDSGGFWILLAQGACRAVGPSCRASRSPAYYKPLASLQSEPLIPTSLREPHQRQAWLPTAFSCFRKPMGWGEEEKQKEEEGEEEDRKELEEGEGKEKEKGEGDLSPAQKLHEPRKQHHTF